MSARVVIRRVRFKSGGEVHLLRPDVEPERSFAEASVRECLDAMPDLAGFAFVAWSADGGSIAARRVNPASRIPGILVPDFVRNRLLGQQVVNWAVDEINEQMGFGPDDE